MTNTVTFELLKKFSPFDSLADEYLQQVANQAQVVSVDKGHIVFKRGRAAADFYFLLEGSVSLIDASFFSKNVAATDPAAHFALNEINKPTKFSAVAQGSVTLLQVNHEQLDQVMAWSQSSANEKVAPKVVSKGAPKKSQAMLVEDHNWVAYLLGSPMFARIPPANLQDLFRRFHAREVAAGETVIKAGEIGDYFYVIAEGRVQVIPVHDAPTDPLYLHEGDYFGEEALAGDTTRNATVKMVKSGTLMCLGKSDFKALLQEPLVQYVDFQDLPELVKEQGDVHLVDVRLPIEYRQFHLPGVLNIPLDRLRNRLSAMERGCLYVVTDDAGARSKVAAQLMAQQGQKVMILRDANQHYSEA